MLDTRQAPRKGRRFEIFRSRGSRSFEIVDDTFQNSEALLSDRRQSIAEVAPFGFADETWCLCSAATARRNGFDVRDSDARAGSPRAAIDEVGDLGLPACVVGLLDRADAVLLYAAAQRGLVTCGLLLRQREVMLGGPRSNRRVCRCQIGFRGMGVGTAVQERQPLARRQGLSALGTNLLARRIQPLPAPPRAQPAPSPPQIAS
jgi:hypothetical protein